MYRIKCFWGKGRGKIVNTYYCEDKEQIIDILKNYPFIHTFYPNVSLLKGCIKLKKLKPGRTIKIPMGIGRAVIKRVL